MFLLFKKYVHNSPVLLRLKELSPLKPLKKSQNETNFFTFYIELSLSIRSMHTTGVNGIKPGCCGQIDLVCEETLVSEQAQPPAFPHSISFRLTAQTPTVPV